MMDTKFLTYPECRGNCSSLSRRFRGSSLSLCDGWRNSNADEAQAEKGEEEGEMSGIEDTSKSESLPTGPPQTQGSEQQMAGAGTPMGVLSLRPRKLCPELAPPTLLAIYHFAPPPRRRLLREAASS